MHAMYDNFVFLLSFFYILDLSLLSYTITPCGATGQEGHHFYQCLGHYRSIGSPVTDHLVSPIRFYPGLQYFKLPRKGRYILTIAGARGGKGVCSPWAGLAPVFQSSATYHDRLTFELAIGQRGGDACGSTEWECLPVNSTIQELVECSDSWQSQPSGIVLGDGGGGGGGGTQLQRVSGQTHGVDRIIVAAGGGGEGATFPNISSTANETRANMKNGDTMLDRTSPGTVVVDTGKLGQFKCNPISPMLSLTVQCLFLVTAASLKAGVGGGTVLGSPSSVDGKGFANAGEQFAAGGDNCASCCIFTDSHGGFGGGGGGCASGGGGGGYGGGDAIYECCRSARPWDRRHIWS